MIEWLIIETILFTTLSLINTFVLVLSVCMLYKKIVMLSNENLKADKITMSIHILLLLTCNAITVLSLFSNINLYELRNDLTQDLDMCATFYWQFYTSDFLFLATCVVMSFLQLTFLYIVKTQGAQRAMRDFECYLIPQPDGTLTVKFLKRSVTS